MSPAQLEKRIERIKQELPEIGPMRPGTLSRQYAACRKPGCACVDPLKPKKHGPFYPLGYSHQGKGTTRFVRPGYVATIRKKLAAYERFRGPTREWLTLSQLRLEQARRELDE